MRRKRTGQHPTPVIIARLATLASVGWLACALERCLRLRGSVLRPRANTVPPIARQRWRPVHLTMLRYLHFKRSRLSSLLAKDVEENKSHGIHARTRRHHDTSAVWAADRVRQTAIDVHLHNAAYLSHATRVREAVVGSAFQGQEGHRTRMQSMYRDKGADLRGAQVHAARFTDTAMI